MMGGRGRRYNQGLYVVATMLLIIAAAYALQLSYRAQTVSIHGAAIEHKQLFTLGKMTPTGDWFSLGRDEVEFLSDVVSNTDIADPIILAPYRSTSVNVRLPDGSEMEVGVAYVANTTLGLISPLSSLTGAPIKQIAPGTAVVSGDWRADLVSNVLLAGPDAYALRVVDRTPFVGIFGERPQLIIHWDDAFALSGLGRNPELRAPFYSVIASGQFGAAHVDRLQTLLEKFVTQTANDAIANGEPVMMRAEPDARLQVLSGLHSSPRTKDQHDRIALLMLFAAGSLLLTGVIVISFVSTREMQLSKHDVALKAALGATLRHMLGEHARRIGQRFAIAAFAVMSIHFVGTMFQGDASATRQVFSGVDMRLEPAALGAALVLAMLWIGGSELLAVIGQARSGRIKATIASQRTSAPKIVKHLGVSALVFMAMVGVAMGVFVQASFVAEVSRMLSGVRPEVAVAELEVTSETPMRRQFEILQQLSASTAGGLGQVLWTTQVPGTRDGLRSEVLVNAIPGAHGPNAFVVASSAAALDRLGAQVLYGDATMRGRRDVLLSRSLAARLDIGADGLGATIYLHLAGLPDGFGMPATVVGIVSDVNYNAAPDGAMAIYLSGHNDVQIPGLSNAKFLWPSMPTRTQINDLESALVGAGLSVSLNPVATVDEIAVRSIGSLRALRSGLLVIASLVLAAAGAAVMIAILTGVGDMRRDIAIRSAVGGAVSRIALQLGAPFLWPLIPSAITAVVVTKLVTSRFFAASYALESDVVTSYILLAAITVALAMMIAIAVVARWQIARLDLNQVLGSY